MQPRGAGPGPLNSGGQRKEQDLRLGSTAEDSTSLVPWVETFVSTVEHVGRGLREGSVGG